jgi:hypothetical protein
MIYGFTGNLQCTGFRGGDGTAVGAIFKVCPFKEPLVHQVPTEKRTQETKYNRFF